MKAFHFRLERALQWREAQLDIEKSRAAGAIARVSSVQTSIERQTADAAAAAAYVRSQPTAGALTSYAGFLERDRSRSRQLKEQLVAAKKNLAAEMERVVEANRKLHLIEKLRNAEQGRWQRAFDRDLGQFADEAFLARFHKSR